MSSLIFDPSSTDLASSSGFLLASAHTPVAILIDSSDAPAIHIAAETFADDIERVVGVRPPVYRDTVQGEVEGVIVAATVGSRLVSSVKGERGEQKVFQADATQSDGLEGKWESYSMSVKRGAIAGAKEALIIHGSDRRGVIYGLYTLSELLGVSPWYWWADVPVTSRKAVVYPRDLVLSHGEPTVKYRGFFLNDEQPVLWNWAKEHFKMGNKPPFQVGMYEKVFELVLRLKGNYMWPAMWASMFAVDGMDVSNGLPDKATPGPNQALADRMGVVMGTSHHEPMSRNQKEYTTWGEGPWDFEKNGEWLTEFWKYGAERAKDLETVYTVGMRGDGDLPLDGANQALLENVTSVQQNTLREVYGKKDISGIPQMWAMYKEVMGYYANGLKVPEEVTALLADDNWGNLMAVLPEDRKNAGGGGIYYHADYVGDPRDYKWTNTVPLAKMWEQLNIARTFNTTQIWICNVGDLKVLEIPLEYFMSIAYDSDALPRDSLVRYLGEKAARDFGVEGKQKGEVADIIATYSIYASRRKAELVDSNTYSIVDFEESERMLADWAELEHRAKAVYDSLDSSRRNAFYEMIYSAIQLNASLNRLYVSAAKSNLFATQSRSAANHYANDALQCFERDHQLTQEYHSLEGGKWKHALSQAHINYQYWQAPLRNSMPPISFISKYEPTFANDRVIHIRYTVEGCRGAWPGDNKFNCPLGYNCPDPKLQSMDRYGRARWVDVGSGGPEDVSFETKPSHPWVIATPASGHIKAGGDHDQRVYLSIDWDKADRNVSEATVVFTSSDDCRPVTITLPLNHIESPAEGFKGTVQGDGYIAIEAGHCQAVTPAQHSGQSYAWEELPYYGRTRSGMSISPVADLNFTLTTGPSIAYDFWATTLPANGKATVTLHIGPSLNFILGKRLAVGVQLDDGEAQAAFPVPEAPLGHLPHDWEDVVANEVREVAFEVEIKKAGAHRLTVWGVTAGVVLERVVIDMGGVKARERTYLGPPESVIVA